MPSLIAFELKKTLSRRVSLLTCIGVALLMCGIMALNVAETRVQAGAGRVLAGTEAIAYERSEAAAHAGILTPQRVREDLEGYRSMAFGTVSPDDVLDVSDEAAYSLMLESHDAATFETMSNKYYAYLLSPWHVRGQEPCQTVAGLSSDEEGDFYGAVDARYQSSSTEGTAGTTPTRRWRTGPPAKPRSAGPSRTGTRAAGWTSSTASASWRSP